MKLSKEQLLEVKKQLIEQVQTTFPEDKKGDTIKQLEEMSDPELIEFVNQNNLIKQSENPNQQCIFCSIIFGDLPSIKVGENEKAIAILKAESILKSSEPKNNANSSILYFRTSNWMVKSSILN